jgi:putative heme iron utilization protein
MVENMSDKAQAARALLLKEPFGVLSTISLDVPGYPFGSVVPYCVDQLCRPMIYISHIAQHTSNILADSRVSLTVMDRKADSGDVQAYGRVTCIANARRLTDQESEPRERYFRYFPSAKQYEQTHDFAFFRLDLVRVRFIGGFGQIYWVDAEEFAMKNPFSFPQESRIIEQMNKDHAVALRRYAGGSPSVMTGIDAEGFDLLVSGRKLRVEFDAPVRNMEQARQTLIRMAAS